MKILGIKLARKLKRAPGFAGLSFEELSPGLHRFLLRRVRDTHDAEDLEQEVYLRLLRVSQEELVRHPEAYIYKIASHVAGRFTSQKRRQPLDYDSDAVAELGQLTSADTPSLDDLCDQRRREQVLAEIVERLPPMQKAVFLLARYHGLSHAEIAERFGISAHTVKKHMLRAICYCRQALTER